MSTLWKIYKLSKNTDTMYSNNLCSTEKSVERKQGYFAIVTHDKKNVISSN